MQRIFWIAMALIGGGLILLVANHDRGTTFGLANDTFANLLYLGVLVLVIGAGLVASRRMFSDAARNIALWLLIVLMLVAGYQYRYELQDVANRVTVGLVPGSPLSVRDGDGATVRLEKGVDGHFGVRAEVDGVRVAFVIDTGATTTVLTAEDARRAGIDLEALRFDIAVSTANGIAQAARATAGEISVGAISRRRLPVLVAAPGTLGQSLLGMNFMNSLSGFDVRGDVMILRD